MKIALKGSLGDIGKALLGILSSGVQLVMVVSGNKNETVGSLKNSRMINGGSITLWEDFDIHRKEEEGVKLEGFELGFAKVFRGM
ncbi:hypothetical protein [Chryseobacterium sp. BIGb0232]|uniref:hypothetical protein n=1 Tax=Chryseobacterium sp. BIGb0232 TaxID=2940598 RepID=UPI000F4A4846|nr:hypothetical protein [Chryseobacterium sp. BIGb0232]MCS4301173.1 hypothetical protein [Chryseobacterium sp. BIGb0232]ROS19966.1 hypothetical protein EDF65_0666 [Chryseobacterium nakagawai]